MRTIPLKLRQQLASDPFYKKCARADEWCSGRITWEHAFRYAGKQINALWAIIPLCWFHHMGKGLNKRINQLIALRRATQEDLALYPKKDWDQELLRLEHECGGNQE